MTNIAAIRDQLIKKATKDTQPKANDPIEVFLGKLEAQKLLLAEAKAGKPVNPRSAWFRKVDDHYVVKIGREALEVGNGNRAFRANDLDDVLEVLNSAATLIQEDTGMRKQIETLAAKRKGVNGGAKSGQWAA